MIGKIGYLVQGARRERERGSSLLVWHMLGGAAGGTLVGAVLGFWAVALSRTAGDSRIWPAVLVIALTLAGLADLGVVLVPWRLPNRQTPGYLTCALGVPAGAFVWGMDIGSLVTTRPPLRGVLVVPLLALGTGSLAGAILTMAAFGIARTGAVAFAVLRGGLSLREECTSVAASGNMRMVATGVLGLILACALILATLTT